MPTIQQIELMRGACHRLAAERPLIHNVTNFVVMNFTANVLLAIGASPAMVHASEEVEEFVGLSRALVVNIGTLDAAFVLGMETAARRADVLGTPWVLDPVGVGATGYRNEVAARLCQLRPAIVRGNASEILALAGASGARPRGVDSVAGSSEALEAARSLASAIGATVAVTGEVDYVVSSSGSIAVSGGSPMSQSVTGTGCATSAVIGAFLAVLPPVEAAVAGLSLMKRAAERARIDADKPGRFAVALIDALYDLSREA